MFYKFFEIFQKSLVSTLLLNVPPEPKFWRRHCSTGLERNSCTTYEILSGVPPLPELKSWRHPCEIDIYEIDVSILYIFTLDMIT